jgi:hypothetical protein
VSAGINNNNRKRKKKTIGSSFLMAKITTKNEPKKFVFKKNLFLFCVRFLRRVSGSDYKEANFSSFI